MVYKINLSDKSFIYCDKTYCLTLFNRLYHKRKVRLSSYLAQPDKYKGYFLVDRRDDLESHLSFTVEECEEMPDIQLGSRLKKSQDIVVGDIVEGVNHRPRKVAELHSGTDELFEIEVNGKSYVVNGGHILELVDKDTKAHLQMPVNVYMHMDDEFRSHYKMEKVVES